VRGRAVSSIEDKSLEENYGWAGNKFLDAKVEMESKAEDLAF
jgi:hypothetical protein